MTSRPSNYNSNSGKVHCNGSDLRRNPNDNVQMTSQIIDNGNQNIANLLLPNSQVTTANPILSYQSASFSGLYSSPGFNTPLTGYENNIAWLSDTRIQNQPHQLPGGLINEKTVNTTHSLPPTTSHSCCVNRFGVLDTVGIGSPVSNEQQGKGACDVPNFQNKSNITMNMIDPIQSWLNLQIPSQISNNQQYCKYGDRPMTQNYNIPVAMSSQMNLPLIDQSDLKQNDMCIQSPDACFESVNSNSKHIDNSGSGVKHNTFPIENKQGMCQDNTMLRQQSSYQSSIISKDWKSTFQSMQNYISSPNVFSTINESQENLLFAQYSIPPTNSYYSPSDNYSSFVNKNSTTCMSQNKSSDSRAENNSLQNSFISSNQTKSYNNNQVQAIVNEQYIPKPIKESGKVQATHRSHGNSQLVNYNCALNDCCQTKGLPGKSINLIENNKFALVNSSQENKTNLNQNVVPADCENQNNERNFKNTETVSSESDESNIIVEESDDIGEIESEISIEEIKKSYRPNEVLLRCLVCNVTTSAHTPANHFIHMNDSFPLTTSSRTPVRSKLEQILPVNLQTYLKLHNSFMCRRCLNLVETVEVLEVKLTMAKQTISDNFSKTIQQLIPEVSRLLQNNDNQSKPLPAEEGDKINTFQELEMTVENECQDDERAKSTSDSEAVPEFQCPFCNKVLSSQKNLNYHLQLHTKEFRYYCERCGKGFSLKSTLEVHLNWHNGDTREVQILCEICGAIFTSKYIFDSHQLKIHSKNINYQCETCGKSFTKKLSLKIHSHKHTGARPFICEFCGHTFVSEPNLKSHIKLCTKDLPHKCDICGKSFVTNTQLTWHKSRHNGVYKLTCTVCGKGFHKPSDLNYHMLSHSSEKQFKCSDCDKVFKTVGNLNYHAKVVHKENKIFKCAVCGKVFAQQILLSDHMNTHANEQPYKCKHCVKSFAHQTTFITHLKSHRNKVNTKTCQVCGKAIKTRMSIHMRTHTGEKPYECNYCPLTFSVGVSLKKHIERKHVNHESI